MSSHVIAFSTPGGMEGAWTRWADPVRLRWPGSTRPRIEWAPLEELIARLERANPDPVAPPAGVLVALGASTPPFLVDRLVEGMSSRNLPGVCLMPRPDDWKHFQRHGIMFESVDADAGTIAAMLFALCERQGLVETLTRELALATRAEGGVRVQIDRMHEEMHLAASIQREFMPPAIPELPGLEMGVVFRPVNYVSGDIYHAEKLPGGRIGVFVADAVGHGVPAALLTMVLSHSLTTTEAGEDGQELRAMPPREVLKRLNDRLCRSRAGGAGGSARFATAVYAVVDPSRGEVTIAGAGHPPPMVVGEGPPRAIETDGPLLGVFADAEFTETTTALLEGQTLVLYTDGLEAAFAEAPGRGGRRDHRRYVEFVTRLLRGEEATGPARFVEELTMALDEQSGSLHQADDVTVVALSLARPTALKRAA